LSEALMAEAKKDGWTVISKKTVRRQSSRSRRTELLLWAFTVRGLIESIPSDV
jgi:hypothetical protein